MNILLVITSRSYGPLLGYAKFPEELLLLSGYLEKKGHQVKIYDRNVEDKEPRDFLDFNPGLIGFQVATGPNLADAAYLSIEFKRILPRTKTVWGFRHPSALPEETLKEPFIDFVIVGPGEYTLDELARAIAEDKSDVCQIKGLAYKNEEGRIIVNEPRPCSGLDDLPDPAWHLVDLNKYRDVSIIASRGCPYACGFCSNTDFYNTHINHLSPNRLVSQMRYLKKVLKVESVFIAGDYFSLDLDYLKEFSKAKKEQKVNLRWGCSINSPLSENHVQLLAKSGCRSVVLEIESGSQRILDFLHKGNLQQIEKTYWLCLKHRILPTIYIMYGFPTENLEEFNQSLELINNLDNPPALFMRFVPYPATKLFEYCLNNNLVAKPRTLSEWLNFNIWFSTKGNLSNIPLNEIAKAESQFKNRFAYNRVRFMFKYNKSYFINIITHPTRFIKDLKSLISNSILMRLNPKLG